MTDPVGTDAARIRRIEISDFRAFPTSQPADILLDGCNLLVFGENGSGKSSVYRALRELFSLKPQQALDHRNRLDPASATPNPLVRVTLSDNTAYEWTQASHPTAAVYEIALRSAFLTHTRLREMNYSLDGPRTPPNLFDYAVETFLADYLTLVSGAGGGGRRTVGELWADVLATQRKNVRRTERYIRETEEACLRFNDGMTEALNTLEVHARPLLRELLSVLAPDGLELIRFNFSPTGYDSTKRPAFDGDATAIRNRRLTAVVAFSGYEPPVLQDFLNEGRQSALAIAICLAARRICVPEGRNQLKLLVMDDLLISMDASHRRPVLKVILEQFSDWQIILLTHDRYWFQLAREQLKLGDWKTVEIYEHFNKAGLLTPVVRPVPDDMAAAILEQADSFLADHHPAAACNYARSACEIVLRRACNKLGVKFQLPIDDAPPPSLQTLLTKAMNAANQPHRDFFETLQALKPHKKFVLNPLSHDPAHPIPRAEVEAAIEAVKAVSAAYDAI